MIEISHLEKSYGQKKVFSDFSMEIQEGETLCLMGASGRGKTTLFRMLLGLEKPDSGSISGLKGKLCSAVFQEDRLLMEFTVRENLLAVCASQKQRQRVPELLEALGLGECLHQKASQLSGGMMRRAAIARALLPACDVLILDEPFQGLDENTKKITADLIKKEAAGKTLIVATHNEEDAVLLEGRIVQI